jgi:hypothetical protein
MADDPRPARIGPASPVRPPNHEDVRVPDRRKPRVANCRLELPDAGPLVATLEVRFQARNAGPGGTERTRCGMQFLNLPTGGMTMLQRYINKLERERRSKG